MTDVYQKIWQNLKEGKTSRLLSEYGPSGVFKNLLEEKDTHGEKIIEKALSVNHVGDKIELMELYAPKPRLLIFGAGHVALPLVAFAAKCGFNVLVYDDRPFFVNPARFPDAETLICDAFDNINAHIKIRKNDYVVIITRGHRHDSLCLRTSLENSCPRYIGMIGSKRRIAVVKRQLEEEVNLGDKLEALHSPIGLNIGAVTPDEIAISILAELIQNKRQAGQKSELEADSLFSENQEVLKWLAGERKEDAALVSVILTDGSTPREAGAKMIVLPFGEIIGSIGGGCSEAAVIQRAREIIKTSSYDLMEIDLRDSAEEDGMVCGGLMKVIIEFLGKT